MTIKYISALIGQHMYSTENTTVESNSLYILCTFCVFVSLLLCWCYRNLLSKWNIAQWQQTLLESIFNFHHNEIQTECANELWFR